MDMEAVVTGTEAGDGAGHMDIETVHLGEHNPPLDGVSLHDGNSRLGLKKFFIYPSLHSLNDIQGGNQLLTKSMAQL